MANITLFRYGIEVQEFRTFLEDRGHTVELSDTNQTEVDGIPASVDRSVHKLIDDLWQEYVDQTKEIGKD